MIAKNQKGGALVELVIVMPILLMLMGGVIDFGAVFYNKQVLTNASREAARAGIVYQVDGSGNKMIIPESRLQTIVTDYCDEKKLLEFGVSSPPSTSAPGVATLAYPNDLTVTVTYTHTLLFASLTNALSAGFGGSGDLGPTRDITVTTVMRME